MPQHYSNPKREQEPHALPDVEVWKDRVSIKGTAESYTVFVRDWWRKDERTGGIVPYPGAPRRTIARHCTEEEAREICTEYAKTHKPGWRSRKAEYTQE
jgi:hypothetical protein